MRVKYPGKPEQIRFTTDLGLIAGGTGRQRGGGGGRMRIWEGGSTHSCSMFVARCHIISWRS